MFEWTQPVGGKVVVWRPLKVGDHIDIEANYNRSDMVHLKPWVTMAARIISIDGIEKAKLGKDDLGLVRDWDEYDFISFKEEIDSRELARSVSLAPQRQGGAVVGLEQAVTKVQAAANELGMALAAVVQKAKEAEQKLGPLK